MRRERLRSSSLRIEVDAVEDDVNARHGAMMRTQTELEHQRERNEQVITLLRKELKKAQHALEAASVTRRIDLQ